MEQRSFLHIFFTVAPSVIIIFTLFQLLFSEYGIFEANAARIQYQQLDHDIGVIEKTNQALRMKVERLKNANKPSHLAGDRLLMGKTNSTLYRFSDAR